MLLWRHFRVSSFEFRGANFEFQLRDVFEFEFTSFAYRPVSSRISAFKVFFAFKISNFEFRREVRGVPIFSRTWIVFDKTLLAMNWFCESTAESMTLPITLETVEKKFLMKSKSDAFPKSPNFVSSAGASLFWSGKVSAKRGVLCALFEYLGDSQEGKKGKET